MNINFTQDMHDALLAEAKSRGVSMHSLIRKVLSEFLVEETVKTFSKEGKENEQDVSVHKDTRLVKESNLTD